MFNVAAVGMVAVAVDMAASSRLSCVMAAAAAPLFALVMMSASWMLYF